MRALLLATVLLATPAAAEVKGIAYVLRDLPLSWYAVFVDLNMCIAAAHDIGAGLTCEAISIKDGEAFVRSRQPLAP